MLMSRVDELFVKLDVPLMRNGKMFFGCCPIHSGDNPAAFNMYHGGDVPGKWVCRTKHCESKYKKTIIGFIRGMLESQGKHFTFTQVIDWCCDFLEVKLENIEVDYEDLEKRSFSSSITHLMQGTDEKPVGVTRKEVRARLKIPSEYFRKTRMVQRSPG